MVTKIVSNTLAEQKLICRGEHILVALSGGADSVCLLHLLCGLQKEYQLKLSALHINHMLRGEEAERDEAFAKKLCANFAVPFFCERFDVAEYARKEHIGTEEAGRRIRYARLERYRKFLNADSIATAHHRDDNIETFFLHLLRGAGLHGLSGIPYRNGNIVRPLLDVSKEEILRYLEAKKLSFVTDSTNGVPNVLRNKIRLELLPLLEQYNPGLRGTLSRNMKLIQSADRYLRQTAEKRFSVLAEQQRLFVAFPLSSLKAEAEAVRFELYLLAVRALRPEISVGSERLWEIDRCTEAEKGAVPIAKDFRAQIFYDKLYFWTEVENTETEILLPLSQVVRLRQTGIGFYAEETTNASNVPNRNTLFLSTAKIKGKPLRIRFRKDGDFFYPLGFGHKKSLQDFFVDMKIPRFLRDHIPLLTVGDEIAWVCGYRADMRFLPEAEENIRTEIKFTEEKNER